MKGVGVGTGNLLQMGTAYSGVKCPRTTYSGVNGPGGHFTSRTVSSVTESTSTPVVMFSLLTASHDLGVDNCM